MAVILVTGGAGFLGSHLCDRLIERGDDVICVDNFFSGREENIAGLIDHPRFELVRHDIVQPLFRDAEREREAMRARFSRSTDRTCD